VLSFTHHKHTTFSLSIAFAQPLVFTKPPSSTSSQRKRVPDVDRPLQVLISGGVGPALCDVTLDGVAKAFDVRLTPDAELLAELQRTHGVDDTPSFLKVGSFDPIAYPSFRNVGRPGFLSTFHSGVWTFADYLNDHFLAPSQGFLSFPSFSQQKTQITVRVCSLSLDASGLSSLSCIEPFLLFLVPFPKSGHLVQDIEKRIILMMGALL
jgi:hypothetical protein